MTTVTFASLPLNEKFNSSGTAYTKTEYNQALGDEFGGSYTFKPQDLVQVEDDIALEISMFGTTAAAMKEDIEDSLTFKFTGPAMVAASMMSDAQEEMSHGALEAARKTLNRAKWVLSSYVLSTRNQKILKEM